MKARIQGESNMSQQGKVQLTFIIVAPPDQVAEGDRLFKTHAPWMKASHPRSGEKALLTYNVSKAPELSNPMDSSSAPTGTHVLRAQRGVRNRSRGDRALQAGVTEHFKQAGESWQDFPALG